MTESPGPPSPWVRRFASLVPGGGDVVDVACGSGRHTRLFLSLGHRVVAVDRDLSGLSDLLDEPRLEAFELDLDKPFPLGERRFAGVVVTNYLHRPLGDIVAAVAPGGSLIYETFARGNERFGRPRRPEFLLEPNELLEAVRSHLDVVAFEDVTVSSPRAAAVQRIAAVRSDRRPFIPGGP